VQQIFSYELIKLTNTARSNFTFYLYEKIEYLLSIAKQRVICMNNTIIFKIYLVNLSEQTSKVTATFEITKNWIISPKAGEKMYRIFSRERKKFLLPAMNEIWFVVSENFQSNCNLEGYEKLTGGI
jgi:hypothetical protein